MMSTTDQKVCVRWCGGWRLTPILVFCCNEQLIQTVKQSIFNPEKLVDELTDDEGIATFKKAAMNHDGYELPRTRSHSELEKSVSSRRFIIGKLVYAHKGKLVPCWFPGVVEKKTKKGYKIKFLAEFGFQDCVTSNMMMFDDYADLKEQDGGKLFMIPERIESNFLAAKEEGFQMSLNGL